MTDSPKDPNEGSTEPRPHTDEVTPNHEMQGRSGDHAGNAVRAEDAGDLSRASADGDTRDSGTSPAASPVGDGGPAYASRDATAPTPPYASTQPTVEYPAFQRPNADAATATTNKRKTGPLIIAGLAIGALIGGAAGAGVTTALISQDDNRSSVSSNETTGTPTNLVVNDPADATVVTAVADEALPSVVTIQVAGAQGGGTGSGVILSEDGYVLTNTHVVTLDGETGSAEVQVKTSDGRNYLADIVGTDPIGDLAVVKLRDASGLRPIEFADSSELNVGELAVAIGAPLGLSGTVTNGIVSALNRSIQVASSAAPEDDSQTDGGGDTGPTPFDFWEFGDENGQSAPQPAENAAISLSVIQTDAAINPGNSGGALLDSDGKLIGINVAIASAGGAQSSSTAGSIGVGFAIPSNFAKRIAGELIEDGQASHGLLGAAVSDVDPDGNPLPVAGTYIVRVTNGGAAAEAGLKAGDVVTSINGSRVASSSDLTAQVRVLEGGTKTEITYVRDGEESTVSVTLGEL